MTNGNHSSNKATKSISGTFPGSVHRATCNRSSEVFEGDRLYVILGIVLNKDLLSSFSQML